MPRLPSRRLRGSFAATVSVTASLAAVVAALLLPVGAHAATDDTSSSRAWAVVPADETGPDGRSSFDYVVEPDTTFTDHVAVRNLGEQPLTVTVYAQDAVQSADNDYEVLTPDEQGARIASWIELTETEVTVPGRAHVVLPFTVAVPADAEPGDHAGGIVAVSAVADGEGAAVQYRVGSRVSVRVGGPIDAAVEVDRVDARYDHGWALYAPAPLDVTATLENAGNVRVSPETQVRIEGIFGWWRTTLPMEGVDLLLPRGAQSAAARADGVPPIGPLWVTVDVVAVDSAGQDITELTAVESHTVVVWAIPWTLVVVIALLLVAATIAVVNLQRRRRARQREKTEDLAPAADAESA